MRRSPHLLSLSQAQIERVHEAASALPEPLRYGFLLRVTRRLNVNLPRWRRSMAVVPEQVLANAMAAARQEVAP